MRRTLVPSLVTCAVLTACSSTGEKSADSAATGADTPAAAVAPSGLNLAEVAGKWDMRTLTETGDSTLVQYELDAKADANGWTITLPGRDPMSLHVIPGGDSVVLHAGPYESVLRKGVQVTTEGVVRLQNGKLVGTQTAHYSVSGPDSVAHRRIEGTRKP